MNKSLAIEFAKEMHLGQNRRDGTPYIEHPLRVAEMCHKVFPKDEQMFCVAVMHDILEDVKLDYQLKYCRLLIFENFGEGTIYYL